MSISSLNTTFHTLKLMKCLWKACTNLSTANYWWSSNCCHWLVFVYKHDTVSGKLQSICTTTIATSVLFMLMLLSIHVSTIYIKYNNEWKINNETLFLHLFYFNLSITAVKKQFSMASVTAYNVFAFLMTYFYFNKDNIQKTTDDSMSRYLELC